MATLKTFITYLLLFGMLLLLGLFLFKPDLFWRILHYPGPGSPFVQPP